MRLQFSSLLLITSYPFFVNLNINLDGLNWWLVFFTIYITLIILVANLDNVNLLLIAAIGLFSVVSFVVSDLFVFFLAFESVQLPIVILLIMIGSRNRKYFAANSFQYYTLFTSLIFLVSIIYIYNQTGSTNYLFVKAHEFSYLEQLLLGFSFVLAFSAKLPVVPFHYWLQEAHVESATSSSIILAAILLKLGTNIAAQSILLLTIIY